MGNGCMYEWLCSGDNRKVLSVGPLDEQLYPLVIRIVGSKS